MITEHPQSASPTGPGGCPPWRVLVLHDITTPLLTHLHDTPVAIRRCFSVPTAALRNIANGELVFSSHPGMKPGLVRRVLVDDRYCR